MAYEIPDFYVGVLPADIDMSAQSNPSEDPQYQFTGVCVWTAVSCQGAGVGGAAIIPPGSTSTPIIGILQNNPQLGEAGSVLVQGVSKCLSAFTGSIGQLVAVNSAGALVAATTGTYAIGQLLESCVSGDITTVLLIRNGKQ